VVKLWGEQQKPNSTALASTADGLVSRIRYGLRNDVGIAEDRNGTIHSVGESSASDMFENRLMYMHAFDRKLS
jgi:hypothetical protein